LTARVGWCVVGVGITPAPDEPVMPTTSTAPESSPAFASGRRPSSMVVAKQPGEAT
jgi:hypothetical protein